MTSCTDRVLTEGSCVPWTFTTRAELKAAVDACLDAVPSGDRCCSSDRLCWHPDPAMRRCGAVGCVDMPDWDVSQVTTAAGMFEGASSFYRNISGWTFADNADTTGMFTGADTWLSRASRDDTVNTTDGPPGAWVFNPVPGERTRRERSVRALHTTAGPDAAGDDPAAGDTGCAFPERAALKAAVDNCLAVDPTGVACCSHGADCGAAGTVEMPDWDVSQVTRHERACSRQRILQRGYIAMGHLERHDHVHDVPRCRRVQQRYRHGTPRASRRWKTMFVRLQRSTAPIEMGRQLGHDHEEMFYDATHSTPCRWAGTHPKSRIYEYLHGATAWNARFTGGGDDTLPRRVDAQGQRVRRVLPPLNGAVGTCTDTLVSGTSCVPDVRRRVRAGGRDVVHRPGTDRVAVCTLDVTTRAELKAAVDACVGDRLCEGPCPTGTSRA